MTFKCPLCDNRYKTKPFLYSHMNNKHKDQLGSISPAQFYFNYKYKKTGGKCIICGKPTKWNESTERYERLCEDPECRDKYREMFRQRMIKKYGKDTLLDDPDVQKKMLDSRKISGEYTWQDGTKTKYVGTYEKDFLEFLDIFLHLDPTDVISPAPQIFDYEYQGKKHFYIPDFYITSINTVIEIKSFDNKHYRQRDIGMEKEKDKAVIRSNFNYIKINDKQYDGFFNYLLKFKED